MVLFQNLKEQLQTVLYSSVFGILVETRNFLKCVTNISDSHNVVERQRARVARGDFDFPSNGHFTRL
jgi:hypothetical protein